MDYASIVNGLESAADLPSDLKGLGGGQATPGFEVLLEILTRDELHHDVLHVLELSVFVDRADVPVPDPASEPDLGAESPPGIFPVFRTFRQDLQGHFLVQRTIVRAIDRAHAAPAQNPS